MIGLGLVSKRQQLHLDERLRLSEYETIAFSPCVRLKKYTYIYDCFDKEKFKKFVSGVPNPILKPIIIVKIKNFEI